MWQQCHEICTIQEAWRSAVVQAGQAQAPSNTCQAAIKQRTLLLPMHNAWEDAENYGRLSWELRRLFVAETFHRYPDQRHRRI